MPLIESEYKPPFYLWNAHLETIVPNALRRPKIPPYTRQRLNLPDGDFLDVDWLKQGSDKVLVVSHGLEGNSQRPYVAGIANYFFERGWDVAAWNCRSCSGEMNKAQRMYHHGDTDDIRYLLNMEIHHKYERVGLTGFSMGGSITLKYLGEEGDKLDEDRVRAAVFSVPCNLSASAHALSTPGNAFYRKRFMRKLFKKIEAKSSQFPHLQLPLEKTKSIKSFPEFDTCFTAPLHGFIDSEDFYAQASSGPHLSKIRVSSLLVNAQNDPMLPKSCFPTVTAAENPYFYLETPERGGHVGFALQGKSETYAEIRAWQFIAEGII